MEGSRIRITPVLAEWALFGTTLLASILSAYTVATCKFLKIDPVFYGAYSYLDTSSDIQECIPYAKKAEFDPAHQVARVFGVLAPLIGGIGMCLLLITILFLKNTTTKKNVFKTNVGLFTVAFISQGITFVIFGAKGCKDIEPPKKCVIGPAGIVSAVATLLWLISIFISSKLRPSTKPFLNITNKIARWTLCSITFLAFILSIVSVVSCKFIKIKQYKENDFFYGAFSYFNHSYDKCLPYSKTQDFDTAEKASRAFGTLAPIFGGIGMSLLFNAILFVQRNEVKQIIWKVSSGCLVAAFVSQLVSFAVFGSDFCKDPDRRCDVGAAGVISILSTAFWLTAVIIIFKVPPPDRRLLICFQLASRHPEQQTIEKVVTTTKEDGTKITTKKILISGSKNVSKDDKTPIQEEAQPVLTAGIESPMEEDVSLSRLCPVAVVRFDEETQHPNK